MSTTQPRRCLRCGRTLRVSAGPYGPVCRARIRAAAAAAAVKGFTTVQIEKAKELIADGGLIPASRPDVFRAVSSRGDNTYLVHVKGHCGCPHGLRRLTTDKLCYHVLAVRLVLGPGKTA
jgi:hypothetical protein